MLDDRLHGPSLRRLSHRIAPTLAATDARIADRTVAEEYFTVSQQVEALYDAEPVLPAGAGGPNMRRLHTETTRRLLGNGYCTRPAELLRVQARHKIRSYTIPGK